jgi:hypothetical protein
MTDIILARMKEPLSKFWQQKSEIRKTLFTAVFELFQRINKACVSRRIHESGGRSGSIEFDAN